ncbi:MAG: hypothetical protein WA915_03315 [Candidatus Aminicenantaceae bacterium]
MRRAGRAWYISPRGDVREAPTSERSFLAGETERVFDIINMIIQSTIHHGFGNASSSLGIVVF